MRNAAFLLFAAVSIGCDDGDPTAVTAASSMPTKVRFRSVGQIPTPKGAERIEAGKHSFAAWLRNLRLRQDNRVFLYNNELKSDQSKHFAVIDLSVGRKDLQHCADAIMRLRAEYFYENQLYDSITFYSSGKTPMHFALHRNGYRYYLSGNQVKSKPVTGTGCESRDCFMQYLETVFAFSGTYNLFEQLKPVQLRDMQPGDVLIKPGSPGHAMIVADVAVNKSNGKKYFILAQSFMPAQDIHIVKNPRDENSPWFQLNESKEIITPNWKFQPGELRTWP